MYRFMSRSDSGIKEVATVDSSLNWKGDMIVIANIQLYLKQNNIDISKPENWTRLDRIFSGSYFWAESR